MKKLILAALLPATVGLAAPAMAQPAPPPPGGWHHGPGPALGGWMTPRRDAAIRQDIGQLRFAIDRAVRNRTISPREAAPLRRQAMVVQRQYQMYARDGLSRDEVRWLASRVNQIRQQLRMERADWDRDRW